MKWRKKARETTEKKIIISIYNTCTKNKNLFSTQLKTPSFPLQLFQPTFPIQLKKLETTRNWQKIVSIFFQFPR